MSTLSSYVPTLVMAPPLTPAVLKSRSLSNIHGFWNQTVWTWITTLG